MFKNMKLRGKMIFGYSCVLAIVLGTLIYAMLGLLSTVRSFEEYTVLSEHSEVAKAIEVYLVESRLAYKKYVTSKSSAYIDEFDVAYDLMRDNVIELKGDVSLYGSEEKAFRALIQQIELEIVTYKNHFEDTLLLEDKTMSNYENLAINGYAMVDQLEYIKDQSFKNEMNFVQLYSGDALQHLLISRLHVTKFFDFHTSVEYDDFLSNYDQYSRDLERLRKLDNSQEFSGEITYVINGMNQYKADASVLQKDIAKIDEIQEDMDTIGPRINSNVSKVIALIEGEQLAANDYIHAENTRKTLYMVALTLLAIVAFIIVLINLLRVVVKPIVELTKALEDIAEGETNTDVRLAVNSTDEIGAMSSAFNGVMVRIGQVMGDVKFQSWLKSGQSELHELARDENDMEHLSEALLKFAVEHVNGLVGRLFLKSNDSEMFETVASYGLGSEVAAMSVKPMEGIVGNTLITKKTTAMHNIPKDYMTIKTGIGSSAPTEILILPCIFNDEVNGVIEIGHLNAFNEDEIALVEGFSEAIGNILHSTSLRANMKVLLDKTIQQSEELQMQQEELRQSNEELEEQTRALKESEQRLQAQQEELRVSNEELEERTKQLELQKAALDEKNIAIMASQEDILEKAYALEQANRYKSEFLANMSHELRTPLNSILVLSQLLGSRNNTRPLSDKEMEFADTIHSSGSDLLTLINGVLDLSKVEAGRLELVEEEVILDELLGEYERLFRPVAQVKGIDFTTSRQAYIPSLIKTDRLRLSQIIKNLVSNAIKFTHDGHVALSVRKPTDYESNYRNLSGENYIAFEVSDTGIGIDSDKKDVIFEAFKQEDGTTSRTYGGTGLGLTISLQLANLMDGDIILESEVGIGSRFVLLIPSECNEQGNSDEEKNSGVKGESEKHTNSEIDGSLVGGDLQEIELPLHEVDGLDNRELLIIEDDYTFANVLKTLADEKGYNAIVAQSGREGLKLARSLKPTAIILDMGLPDMEGIDVAKELEKNDATKDIPIHVISGRDIEDESHMPRSIIGFLKKPVDIKTIYRTLAKIELLNDHGLKKLLVVGHCGGESFEHFTNLGQVEVVKVDLGSVGIEALKQERYGCVVLDTKLEDMTGMSFMSAMNDLLDEKVPVIIYTEEDVNFDEYEDMSQHAESVIIKSGKSKERLADEVTLFLHDMNKTIDQFKGTVSKTLKANVKHKIEESELSGKKVLLVDDDERNVFALLHALEQHGLDVVIAKDGFGAIDAYKEDQGIDIILMDIMMPKMDGYEAIKKIRAIEVKEEVPIIALTAKAMAEDRERCIKAGANDYLTKPIDIEQLMSLMKVWMT